MSDYGDYDNYGGGEDEIIDNYEPNEWENYDQQDEGGLNFDDMIIEARALCDTEPLEAIKKFQEVIELENDNSSSKQFSFTSFQYLSIINIREKNLDEFCSNFTKLVELYEKVDYNIKQETMREINFALGETKDEEFFMKVSREIIDALYEKMNTDRSIDRELLSTGVQFAKYLLIHEKIDELGAVLEEMFDNFDRMSSTEDESIKAYRLEFIVMKIQYCNHKKLNKESKELYMEAYALNKDKIITDNTISAIINEQGGKLFMSQRDYEKALEMFKLAFYNYQESGNNARAKTIMKYAILNSIIVRNSKNIVSPEEVKHYKNDPQLSAMLELQRAYEDVDITSINEIWNEKISKIEQDPFILEQLNEILHNIRFNYIRIKLNAYKVCTFATLEKELGVKNDYLVSILLELTSSEMQNAKINFMKNYIEIFEVNQEAEANFANMNKWVSLLNNQA